ncbi:MAG: outer membrane protein transport protein, partial [Gallionellaceae bacterium]|nr:outer membrane protein transport protein [Gallionellaceae bacterium]
MKLKQTALVYSIAAALSALSGQAVASGYALIEQNASGLGNAYAGGAASAEDASTIYFNPAGMTRLRGKQGVVAVHLIKPSMKFTGTVLFGND